MEQEDKKVEVTPEEIEEVVADDVSEEKPEETKAE